MQIWLFLKTNLALIAIIISLTNLFWNVFKEMADIQLTKKILILTKEFPLDYQNKTGYFGYNVHTYLNETFDKFRLNSTLIAKYSDTNETIPNINPAFTVQEITDQLKLKKIENYFISKHYIVKFQIENLGKTKALDVKVKIFIEDPVTKEWQNVVFSKPSVSMIPNGEPIHFTTGYSIPLDIEEPEIIKYKIEISYKNILRIPCHKELEISWKKKDNSWSYTN